MTTRRHYVYVVFRPNGIPCYVGKGCGDRWKRHDRKRRQNPHFAAILDLAGGDLPTVVIRSGLTNKEACGIEIAFIAAIGREIHGGSLVNLTDGGDGGTPGAVMSPEWRANRSRKAKEWYTPERCAAFSARMKGNKYTLLSRSEEWRDAIAKGMRGNTNSLGIKHTAEARAKMSIAQKGRKFSDTHKAKISAANRRRVRSPETGARISAALKGRKLSEKQKRNIGRGGRGRVISPQTKQRMAAEMRRRWADPEYKSKMRSKLRKSHKMSQSGSAAIAEANKHRARAQP